jgi:aminoglycoside phosphotransferase (APT) family kinase protein
LLPDLEAHLGPVESMEPVQGFVGNATFRVRTAAGATYYFKSGAGMLAEAQACALAAEAGVPAPEVVASGTGPAGEYLILREAPGAPVDTSAKEVLTSAGRELVKLHQVPGNGFGRLNEPLHPTWTAWLTAQVASLDGLVDAGLLPKTHHKRLTELVTTQSPEPEHPVLLHGDLHPRHLYATNGTLSAIIDWGDALYGDPLFDLARFSIAGPKATSALLHGYNLDPTPDLERTFPLYRALWSAIACQAELEANGDWFQPHLTRIAADLTLLS